jgi:tripartite-type tricarboxylate transporter receptor subunit TctC
MNRSWIYVVALAGASTLLGVPSAAGETVAEFYKGKRIIIAIGNGAGGSYDNHARLLARHMGRLIPGEPSFIPQGMPGAGSRKAANWLYNVAPKDGTAMAVLSQNIPLDQALNKKGVKFDVQKFNWIGNPFLSNNLITVWHTAGVKTLADAEKKEITIGGSGGTSPSLVFPNVCNQLLGTKFKIISGYKGGEDITLAMERGEVDGRGSNSWSSWKSARRDWIASGKIFQLIQVGPRKEADLPNVPLLIDLARNQEEKLALELISAPISMGRPFVTTPNVPADRLAALRKAFMDMVKDPEYLADASKRQMEISPMSGNELQELAEKIATATPAVLTKVRTLMTVQTTKLKKDKKGKKQ